MRNSPAGLLQLPPLSLYIHVPWCVEKCPYCDFNSHAMRGELPEQAYVAALLNDLRTDLNWVQGREIVSIFIGGGTPSLLSVNAIEQLLSGIRNTVALSHDCEITMEANPGTVEADKFAGFVKAGVNRLSIGVQSLQSEQLNLLGRIHDPQQAVRAAQLANKLPINSFNLDLMHGLPQQQLDGGLADLQQAIDLGAPHLSWYQLTLEPNTPFYRQPPALPDDDVLDAINEQGHQLLEQAGYQRYEISGYAKPGFECRHNLNYWTFGDYLGIGCGAHGKITLPEQQRIVRSVKITAPNSYLAASPNVRLNVHDVAKDEVAFEYFMNRARLRQPAPFAEFEQSTGLAISAIEPFLQQQQSNDTMILTADNWQMTDKGLNFFNQVIAPLAD
ncbi:radical SAM family heme chaperone HemW [Neiella marina]|uniref:Heme chaperone HemW n=1 Tax=Neiella holothuriorum TaxID=2870530 RepID=A0ABS7EJX6_9GAMM|nr:radical SAM family heme chaperone HemW [Neiella holothuriorum]MBW8192657.1 radical SAM family heme chaperone HemW [Neiella holothuriorum]